MAHAPPPDLVFDYPLPGGQFEIKVACSPTSRRVFAVKLSGHWTSEDKDRVYVCGSTVSLGLDESELHLAEKIVDAVRHLAPTPIRSLHLDQFRRVVKRWLEKLS